MNERVIIEASFKKNTLAATLLYAALGFIGVGLVMNLVLDSWILDYGFYNLFVSPEIPGTWVMLPGWLLLITYFVFKWMMDSCSLTITDKKVSGRAGFKKQVDLPLSQISAVGLGWASSIAIGTSSGKLTFWHIANRDEVYKTLSDLLSNTNKVKAVRVEPAAISNADELKKYKDLLDAGIITQEEFDAKKKQLLGL